MRFVAGFAGALSLAVGSLTVYAQQPSSRVELNVIAVDSAGHPVPDLTASDFKVFDNGSPQQIVSVRVNQTDGPSALVILFDLMNSNLSSRGEIENALKKSLSHLPSSAPLYLYLLAEDGSLYPVHGLPAASAVPEAADRSWVENIGTLLDTAMRKTLQLRPEEIRGSSPVALPTRFNTTCRALDDMRARMATLSGPKELLWITYGFPSTIHMEGGSWWDGGPILREFGARFVQSGITGLYGRSEYEYRARSPESGCPRHFDRINGWPIVFDS